MMNCGALSLVSKKQTKTAPSSTCSETTGLFNTSTDVLGVRNLMTELGMHQEYPTVIYQDNKSTIQIANNRGSLGKASRAMDLEVLAIRNRIEDHEVNDDVEYDEESAFSAHGFDPADRNEDYRVVRLRGGADDGNQNADNENQDAKDDYDWRADLRSESPSFLAVPELSYDDVTQPIGPLVQLSQYDPEDIFSMKLKSSDGILYNDEIDDLPDPRIYDINVEELYLHVLLFIQEADTSRHPFHDYGNYL